VRGDQGERREALFRKRERGRATSSPHLRRKPRGTRTKGKKRRISCWQGGRGALLLFSKGALSLKGASRTRRRAEGGRVPAAEERVGFYIGKERHDTITVPTNQPFAKEMKEGSVKRRTDLDSSRNTGPVSGGGGGKPVLGGHRGKEDVSRGKSSYSKQDLCLNNEEKHVRPLREKSRCRSS